MVLTGPLGNTGEPADVARGPVGERYVVGVGPGLCGSPAADPAGRPVLLPVAVHEFLDRGPGTLKIADLLRRRARGRCARRPSATPPDR